ncbi:DUF3093 family protein [Streptomyces xanthophaeus]|uniref:DUF3093 family protein n=1 Tax=Streptomyces xanthophaeus TaxID=67385 RepID=UPI00368457C8
MLPSSSTGPSTRTECWPASQSSATTRAPPRAPRPAPRPPGARSPRPSACRWRSSSCPSEPSPPWPRSPPAPAWPDSSSRARDAPASPPACSRIENTDPQDPTPYVYVSTRAPRDLAAAIAVNR